jgi:hypothetical protein
LSLAPSGFQEIASLVTDLAIVVSLVVLAYQVYLQRKETKFNTYEKLMSDYTAQTMILMDYPEVLDLTVKGTGQATKWEKYSVAEKKAYLFFAGVMSLLERVWVSKQDWSDWKNVVENLLSNVIFMDVFNDNKGTFDEGFAIEIESLNKLRKLGSQRI